MAYVPDSSPVVPVVTAEPEVQITPFAPRPSLPVKFVPYDNLAAGNGGLDVQYAQPVCDYITYLKFENAAPAPCFSFLTIGVAVCSD